MNDELDLDEIEANARECRYDIPSKTGPLIVALVQRLRQAEADRDAYEKFVDRRIDELHGPGAAAALEKAFAEGYFND